MTSDKVLAAGPFLGDLQTEILVFRPYVTWLQTYVEHSKFFINSHFNRKFLYNGAAEFVPVYEFLTRDELNQKDVTHKEVVFKDYQNMQKDFKKSISKDMDCKMNQILTFSLPYNSSTSKTSQFHMKYTKIKFNKMNLNNEDEFIVYIPDKRENIKRTIEIYDRLKSDYENVIVIGDLKTHLIEENVVLKKPDYTRNSHNLILAYRKSL